MSTDKRKLHCLNNDKWYNDCYSCATELGINLNSLYREISKHKYYNKCGYEVKYERKPKIKKSEVE